MTATSPLTVDAVLEAALKLPIDAQYELASRLEAELHGGEEDSAPPLSKEWENEIALRVAEVDAGTAELIPAGEVLAEMRAMLGKKS